MYYLYHVYSKKTKKSRLQPVFRTDMETTRSHSDASTGCSWYVLCFSQVEDRHIWFSSLWLQIKERPTDTTSTLVTSLWTIPLHHNRCLKLFLHIEMRLLFILFNCWLIRHYDINVKWGKYWIFENSTFVDLSKSFTGSISYFINLNWMGTYNPRLKLLNIIFNICV
jgi:hypothetical protein